MKLLDRFTGQAPTELPERLQAGRYCVLEPCEVNGHSRLQTGEILMDDGSHLIRIQDAEWHVLASEQSDKERADSDLAGEAIVSIAAKLAAATDAMVSPMLPAELAAQCELDELERELAQVLKAGHLHSISERPRIDLRYVDAIAPVARARRLANSALSHLASHSDCWQQRTLSGVQPRRVLARFSEDDHAIYENRLYKRLLDRLDRHLTRRLARIRSVNSTLEKALEFEGSEVTHFRLRQGICRLWGEAYLDDKTGGQLEEGLRALAELEKQLRAVRGLRQGGLYSMVPASAVVPAQIHRTNILNHDPHYRRLPPLWDKLNDDRDERLLPPEDRMARQLQLQRAYSAYVGLVIRRALEGYAGNEMDGTFSFHWAGCNYTLAADGHDWVLAPEGRASLRMVPFACFGASIAISEDLASDRIVCWAGISSSISSPQLLPVSPMDLYVVERMGRMIDQWMLTGLVKGYGRKLGPLTAAVKKITDGWPAQFQSCSAAHARLLAPLEAEKAEALRRTLRGSANQEIEREVGCAIEEVAALSRLCGHQARFETGDQETFFCQCPTCQATWQLKAADGRRRFSMRPKGASAIPEDDGFLWAGRGWHDFAI